MSTTVVTPNATSQTITSPVPLPASLMAALGMSTNTDITSTTNATNATTIPPTASFSNYVGSFFGNLSPLELGLIAGGLIFLVMAMTDENGGPVSHRRRRSHA